MTDLFPRVNQRALVMHNAGGLEREGSRTLELRGDSDDSDNPLSEDEESSVSFGRQLTRHGHSAKENVALYLCNPIARSALLLGVWFMVGMIGLTLLDSREEEEERLDWVDTVYLMCQIITTVGYGDLPPPRSTADLLFYTVYVLSSIMLVAQIVGSFIGKVAEPAHDGKSKAPSQKVDSFVDPRFTAFAKAFASWFGFVWTFTIFFMYWPNEEKPFIEAMYMAVITLTTVGFGDQVPQTKGGKLFASVWMVAGTGAFTIMIGKFGIWTFFMFNKMSVESLDVTSLKRIHDNERFKGVAKARAHVMEDLLKGFELENYKEVSKAYAEKISRNDFLVFMIVDMGLVDIDMIETLSEHFDSLDCTGEGYIDRDDLEKAMHDGHTEKEILEGRPSAETHPDRDHIAENTYTRLPLSAGKASKGGER